MSGCDEEAQRRQERGCEGEHHRRTGAGDEDGRWGFPAHDQIDAVAGKTGVCAPVPEPKTKTKKDEQGNAVQQDAVPDKHQPKPGDSEAVASWRVRMASEEAKELYKQRAATAECVNAQARNRGLLRMPVRGLTKVRCVVGHGSVSMKSQKSTACGVPSLGMEKPSLSELAQATQAPRLRQWARPKGAKDEGLEIVFDS